MRSERGSAPAAWPPLPEDEWPELDRKLREAAQAKASLLDEGGIASSWRSATLRLVTDANSLWLGWLSSRGELSGTDAPASRVTRRRIEHYLADLRTRYSDATVGMYLHHLHGILRAMNAGPEIGWLARLARRISDRAKPARPKAPRLIDSRALFALGLELMDQAQARLGRAPTAAAVHYRDGLQIAMLACRPLRRGELLALRLDETVEKIGDRYLVRLAAGDTKNRRTLECPYPAELTERIDFYISEVRPVLAAREGGSATGCNAFWLSRRGNPMDPGHVSRHIRLLRLEYLGRDLCPHLFRDCAATSVAIEDPGHIGIVKDVLGHSTLRTSQKYYNQANSSRVCAAIRQRCGLSETTPADPREGVLDAELPSANGK